MPTLANGIRSPGSCQQSRENWSTAKMSGFSSIARKVIFSNYYLFVISESINGVVSLAKDRPALILPEEVTVVEDAVKQLSDARRYRVAVKHNQIESYERVSPDYETLTRKW